MLEWSTHIYPSWCIYIKNIYMHPDILHRYCDSFFPPAYSHIPYMPYWNTHSCFSCTAHTCPSHWCEVTRLSCLQTGHQTGQWTLGRTIEHDSTDSALPPPPPPYTHRHTRSGRWEFGLRSNVTAEIAAFITVWPFPPHCPFLLCLSLPFTVPSH